LDGKQPAGREWPDSSAFMPVTFLGEAICKILIVGGSGFLGLASLSLEPARLGTGETEAFTGS
jgi:hypothetical protein